METDKQKPAPGERYMFTPEELQRMKAYLELQEDREELIGLLDSYSYSFADWSIIINESIQKTITEKQKSGISYEKEQNMLKDVSFLFNKIAFFSEMIAEWHKQLALGNKLNAEMIQNGHP